MMDRDPDSRWSMADAAHGAAPAGRRARRRADPASRPPASPHRAPVEGSPPARRSRAARGRCRVDPAPASSAVRQDGTGAADAADRPGRTPCRRGAPSALLGPSTGRRRPAGLAGAASTAPGDSAGGSAGD